MPGWHLEVTQWIAQAGIRSGCKQDIRAPVVVQSPVTTDLPVMGYRRW